MVLYSLEPFKEALSCYIHCISDFDVIGVIYLKNMVMQHWEEKEAAKPTDPVPFSIHEQDRATIRSNIIEAILHAPEVVR